MRELTVSDASLLALVAENATMPRPEFDKILARISDDSKPIARAIWHIRRDEDSGEEADAAETARSLIKWADTNKSRRPRSSTAPRPRARQGLRAGALGSH